MCSISINKTVDKQLDQLQRANSRDKTMIEKRLFGFADEANSERRGSLDASDKKLKRMPPGLENVRKIRIGRHRVYYVGSHWQCSYKAFYIKMFKKSDVDQEDSRRFQERLLRALAEAESGEQMIIQGPQDPTSQP